MKLNIKIPLTKIEIEIHAYTGGQFENSDGKSWSVFRITFIRTHGKGIMPMTTGL